VNKEIEFRAWDFELKQFDKRINGLNIRDFGDLGFTLTNYKKGALEFNQYTGFVDINGIKIFEGDVVHISGIGNYVVKDIRKDFDMLVNAKVEGDLNEIVGNIYEHKELITEVKNG